MTTGQLIKAARKKAGMTQAELADKLGIPYQSVSQWERDTRNPKHETLQRIARALGVSLLSLIDWDLVEEAGPDEVEPPEIMEEILKDFPYQTEYGPMSAKDIDRAISHLKKRNSLSALDKRLISAYTQLNQSGQSKVADYAEDILPRYRAETAPQSPPAPQEGKDTTPPPDAPETPPEGE